MLSLARHRLVNAGGGGLPFLRSFSRTTTSSRASTFSTLDKNRISAASPPLALSFPLRSDGRFLQHDRASGQLCFVCRLRSCLMYAGCVDCSSHLSSSLQPGPWFSYARSSLDACSCACRAVPWPSMICRFYTGLACFVKYHVFERAGCHINVDWWVRG